MNAGLTNRHLAAAEMLFNPWPEGLEPGSLGPLQSPDDRDPDCHAWLAAQIERARALQADGAAARAGIHTEFTLRYAWSIPSREALDCIARVSPNGVLEVGAGNGYWTFLLRSRGVDVRALERFPVETGANPAWSPGRSTQAHTLMRPWTKIEPANGKEIAAYGPQRTLMLCWLYSVRTLQTYLGDTIVFVGEGRGRNRFDDFYDELTAGWMVTARIGIPRFLNSHDSVWIFRRKAVSRPDDATLVQTAHDVMRRQGVPGTVIRG